MKSRSIFWSVVWSVFLQNTILTSSWNWLRVRIVSFSSKLLIYCPFSISSLSCLICWSFPIISAFKLFICWSFSVISSSDFCICWFSSYCPWSLDFCFSSQLLDFKKNISTSPNFVSWIEKTLSWTLWKNSSATCLDSKWAWPNL